jgi:uncharacterized protein (DUF433 family)
MSEEAVAISRDPGVMSGTPVFAGTRMLGGRVSAESRAYDPRY